ncbi:MAG: hypothetical protein AAFO75_02330 [Pseudomonadota bacterium]
MEQLTGIQIYAPSKPAVLRTSSSPQPQNRQPVPMRSSSAGWILSGAALAILLGAVSQVATLPAFAQQGGTQTPPSSPNAGSNPSAQPGQQGTQAPSGQRANPQNDYENQRQPDFGGCPYRERELEMLV